MKFLLFAGVILSIACGLYAQSFACITTANFRARFDGSNGQATCSNGFNLRGRCEGCCEAWGLNQGLRKDQITGFITTDGRDCACCGFFGRGNTNLAIASPHQPDSTDRRLIGK